MKRSGKFYRKNEKEVMESLGLKATPNSGSGWIIKEDGQNEYLICQLKSTDAQSIKVNQKDIRILEDNAAVEHKIPIFAIQFLNTNEVWLLCKPESLPEVAEYINTGKVNNSYMEFLNDLPEGSGESSELIKVIKSSGKAREKFHDDKNKKYDKTKTAN